MQLKKLSLIALSVITGLSLVSTGCSKSNNNNSAAISATVSGSSYTPQTSVAWYSKDSAIYEIGGYTIKSGDTSGLAITIAPPFTLNTAITDMYAVTVDYYKNSNEYFAGYGEGHASITVTSLDSVNHKIAGNFTGVLYNFANNNDSIVVTNGKFNTSFIAQP